MSPPGPLNRPLWRAWVPWWLLGTACAPIVGLIDAITVARPFRHPQWVLEAGAVLGLTTALLSLVSLVQAPLLAMMSRAFHHRFRNYRGRPQANHLVWMLATGLVAASAASIAARQLMLRTDGFQVRAFAVALVSVGAGFAAFGGAGLALGLRKVIRGLWPFRTGHSRSLALLLTLVGGALIAVCQRMLAAYGTYLADLSVLVWVGLFVGVELLLGALVLGIPRKSYRWLVSRTRGRWLPMVGFVVPAVGLLAGTHLLDANPPVARRVASRDTLSSFALLALRKGTDYDGDGASALFGEGDCAPFDARIGPRSRDVPGNGVDENCDGRDAHASSTEWQNGDPHYRSTPAGLVSAYNIIMVCFDAVRFDHLGFYGHGNDTSPYLDSLADESWVFEHAIAPSATTRLSLAALFSGRYSSGLHWIERARVDDVSDESVFLAEILSDAGYQTFGVVDEWLPRFVPTMSQGFAEYEPAYRVGTWREHGHRAGPFIAAKALPMMVGRDMSKPYFLYLHYEAPHHPYQRHSDLRDFGGRPVDRYDAEIAYADHHLGLLMSAFEVEGWLDDTVIVFFSDHGEEFQEHGHELHSRALYEESVRVPLLVHVPGQAPGRFDGRVSLVDVLPTLLDLTGNGDDELDLHGRSLLYRVLGDDTGDDRQILTELEVGVGRPDTLTALYHRDNKLIWNVSTGDMELFDLGADPQEQSALDDADLRSSMHDRLDSMLQSIAVD